MQLVQLQQSKKELEALGYSVAAISYDSRVLQDEFARRKGIDFQLIADPQSTWLTSVGLVNREGTGLSKGVALPATLVLDKQGKITHLYKESAYQDRLTPATLVEILSDSGTTASIQAQTTPPTEVIVTTSQSETLVTAGSLFSVSVTVSLPSHHHIYGPDAKEVIPVSLKFQPHPLLEVTEVLYPPAKEMTLLGENYPAYEGRVTFSGLVKVRYDKEIRSQLAELKEHPLKAILEYQVCTDTLCLLPQNETLEWTLDFQPLDGQRSPEELQHK